MNDRDRKILRLRKKGFEIEDISDIVGVSKQAVKACLDRAIQSINDEHTIDSVKAIEISRLNEVHKTYYPKALQGDDDAAKMVLAVHDRSAKMFGLHKEVFDANLTVGLVGVLASLSGRPNPAGEGAIEHSALEEGPSSVREGSPGSGTGGVASGELAANGRAQLPVNTVRPWGGEVSGPQLDDSVVDDVLLPGEGRVYGPEQPSDVRRAVERTSNVAPKNATGFKVRLPVKSG